MPLALKEEREDAEFLRKPNSELAYLVTAPDIQIIISLLTVFFCYSSITSAGLTSPQASFVSPSLPRSNIITNYNQSETSLSLLTA